jgi:NTE family protein
MPGGLESLFGATSLIMRSVVLEKLRTARPPEIFIRPPTGGINVLDFTRAARVIKASEPVKDEIKKKLDRILGAVEVQPRMPATVPARVGVARRRGH